MSRVVLVALGVLSALAIAVAIALVVRRRRRRRIDRGSVGSPGTELEFAL